MVNETQDYGISLSPFDALKKGEIDKGLTGLAGLMHGSNIHRLALDLYNFEQESDITRRFSSAHIARLRVIKMRAYDKIEDDLKQRRVVLDYPPRPEDVEEAGGKAYLESLWDVLEKIPKAVIAAGLKEAVVVLPYGKRHLPHTRVGFFEEFSEAGIMVNGESDTGEMLGRDGVFSINALPIDLTQSAEVILLRGRVEQQYDNSETQPRPTLYEPISLVTKKDDGLFHISVCREDYFCRKF